MFQVSSCPGVGGSLYLEAARQATWAASGVPRTAGPGGVAWRGEMVAPGSGGIGVGGIFGVLGSVPSLSSITPGVVTPYQGWGLPYRLVCGHFLMGLPASAGTRRRSRAPVLGF